MSGEVKKDFLDIDDPINGQSYVLLSFVSPNEVMKDKEGFKVAKFLQSYSKENSLDFDKVYNDYNNFIYKYQDDIQSDYDKQNNFKTNVQGVKVRGVYNVKEEAEMRAKRLQQKDPSFNIFIGQVGYWLPWNPCADKIESEVFLNEQLNDLVKQYKENNEQKDIIYEEQKREKIEAIKKENLVNQENVKTNHLEYNSSNIDIDQKKLNELVKNEESEPSPEPELLSEPEPELEPVKVDSSVKDGLDGKDPWLQKKESCDA
jgi:hypothetical protein